MTLDNLDLKIIGFLQEDGTIPNNDVASKLQVSEGTIRNRVKKLNSNNIFQIKGLVNPDKIDGSQIIYLGINVSLTKNLKTTGELINAIEEVKSVSIVSGRYDLIVEIFIDPKKFINFLSDRLSKIESIISTESFMALESFNKWV
jgi:Lrp/AsnC family transcriptional regulator, regulator for asnA, asnC and gidA